MFIYGRTMFAYIVDIVDLILLLNMMHNANKWNNWILKVKTKLLWYIIYEVRNLKTLLQNKKSWCQQNKILY